MSKAYAVQQTDGYWVGIWNTLSCAENVLSKTRHDAKLVVMYTEDELETMRDEWYSPEHMDKVQERTIDPLKAELMGVHTALARSTEEIFKRQAELDKANEIIADLHDACRQKQEIIDTERCLVEEYLAMNRELKRRGVFKYWSK